MFTRAERCMVVVAAECHVFYSITCRILGSANSLGVKSSLVSKSGHKKVCPSSPSHPSSSIIHGTHQAHPATMEVSPFADKAGNGVGADNHVSAVGPGERVKGRTIEQHIVTMYVY